jgi:hypothetical protein
MHSLKEKITGKPTISFFKKLNPILFVRTNTEYEDSMITKIFLFQFVNSYASFFYLAFVAENLGDCPENGCMSLLAINLAIIFGSRLLTGNLLELLLPYLSYQYKYRTQILVHGDALSRPEKEYMLDPVSFHIILSLFPFLIFSFPALV